MKQPILVDSFQVFHNPNADKADPYDFNTIGIKVSLHKRGYKPRQFGAVARFSDEGLDAELLGHLLNDWKEEVQTMERKVRYGRNEKLSRNS